jgi:hypothetical protein
VSRYGFHRRKLWFTPRGIHRLQARAYRTFHFPRQTLEQRPPNVLPGPYAGTSVQELGQRLRNREVLAMLAYRDNRSP